MVTPGTLNRRAQLFEQLAAMIAAGVPLTKAMEMAARNRSTGIPRKVLEQLTHHLQEGHTFADAMQLVSGQKRATPQGIEVSLKSGHRAYALSEFDVALLSAGEESGRLDATFKLLARYYASRAKIINDTISGSIITIVTLHVFLVVFPIGFLIAFVQGIVNNQFSQCLPFLIEKAVVFGLLYAGVASFAFAGQGNRSEGWRALVESIFSIVPVLRTAIKDLALARLAMALEALTNAGVPVVRSWELASAACGSPHLKREVLNWTPQLEHGTTPADMVAQINYFPDTFTQLYQSGEISGKMDDTLIHLRTFYEEEGFRKLTSFRYIVTYVVYFAIAIAIGIFIIRFWLNYFSTALNAFQ
jgi:type II secretory pathway component PulF